MIQNRRVLLSCCMRFILSLVVLVCASCGSSPSDVEECHLILGEEICFPYEFEGRENPDGSLIFELEDYIRFNTRVWIPNVEADQFVAEFVESEIYELWTDCSFASQIHLREFRTVGDNLPRLVQVVLATKAGVVVVADRYPARVAEVLGFFASSIHGAVPSPRYPAIEDFCALAHDD